MRSEAVAGLSPKTGSFASSSVLVDVVVPAKNEQRDIVACLNALQGQRFSRNDFTITVVDNGSTDQTLELVESAGVDIVCRASGLVGEVRNAGASRGAAPFLAFVDADCVVREDWLKDAMRVMQDPGVGAVGGGYLLRDNHTWVESTWNAVLPSDVRSVERLAGGSFIVRRALFEELGGFSPTLTAGEDDELSNRIRAAGYVLKLVPGCFVIHLGTPRTLQEIVQRQRWHGSDQLRVSGLWNGLVIMTHLFSLGCVLCVLSTLFAATHGPILLAAGGLLVVTPVFSLAQRRMSASSAPNAAILRFIAVAFAFFFGRSQGLAVSYVRVVNRALRSRRKLTSNQ